MDETRKHHLVTRRNRPGGRSARVVAAIHEATIGLLLAGGYRALRIPAIAEAAKVDQSSIYRRWPSKLELVLDIALSRVEKDIPIPDTGTLASDLSMLLREIFRVLASPFGEGLLHALIARGPQDIALQRERIAFWEARFSAGKQIVEMAIQRRELPAQTDARQLLEFVISPLLFRFLGTLEPITDAEIDALAQRAIAAFRYTRDSEAGRLHPSGSAYCAPAIESDTSRPCAPGNQRGR